MAVIITQLFITDREIIHAGNRPRCQWHSAFSKYARRALLITQAHRMPLLTNQTLSVFLTNDVLLYCANSRCGTAAVSSDTDFIRMWRWTLEHSSSCHQVSANEWARFFFRSLIVWRERVRERERERMSNGERWRERQRERGRKRDGEREEGMEGRWRLELVAFCWETLMKFIYLVTRAKWIKVLL